MERVTGNIESKAPEENEAAVTQHRPERAQERSSTNRYGLCLCTAKSVGFRASNSSC